VQAAFFLPIAVRRFIDVDEGSYVAAATLVLDGAVPYRDFLYVQMPLMPYVYGAWIAVLGESWYTARLLSVLLATGVGLLLYRHAQTRFGRWPALLGVGLYASSGLVFAWYPTVKTYALSTLLLFGAYVLVEGRGAGARWRWLGAGLLLGLAVDTRLLFAAAIPAFAWTAARDGAGSVRRRLAPLGSGLLLGLLPSLALFALDPGRFLFDNLGYHATRSDGLVADVGQKARVVANLVGVGTPDGGLPQFLLLLLVAATAALVFLSLDRRIPLALSIAALLGIASLLPTPTYPQYMAATVPFLVITVLELVTRLRVGLPTTSRVGRAAATVAALWALGYVGLGLADLDRYLTRHADKRIGPARAAAAFVEARTRPGEAVLTPWPGYLFGTHAVPVAGLENDFAPHVAAALSADDAQRYRMATITDVERMIREHRTRVVVYKHWVEVAPPVPDWRGELDRSGYLLIGRPGGVEVYEAR
jgi:4-amino-4-deoxy-L-arabinose transferase-like glycosyltransferase